MYTLDKVRHPNKEIRFNCMAIVQDTRGLHTAKNNMNVYTTVWTHCWLRGEHIYKSVNPLVAAL